MPFPLSKRQEAFSKVGTTRGLRQPLVTRFDLDRPRWSFDNPHYPNNCGKRRHYLTARMNPRPKCLLRRNGHAGATVV